MTRNKAQAAGHSRAAVRNLPVRWPKCRGGGVGWCRNGKRCE